jgi:hypothetical protein
VANSTGGSVDQNRLSFFEIGELIQCPPGSENDMRDGCGVHEIERLRFECHLMSCG